MNNIAHQNKKNKALSIIPEPYRSALFPCWNKIFDDCPGILDNILNNEDAISEKLSQVLNGKYIFNTSKSSIFYLTRERFRDLLNNETIYKDKSLEKSIKSISRISYCQSALIPSRRAVSIVRDSNGHHSADGRNLVYCGNVWLCPSCRSYIMSSRCRDVDSAFQDWTKKGGLVYMLTLTVGHRSSDSAVYLVDKMKKAYKSLRDDRSWDKVFSDAAGPLKQSIISNWEFTFGEGGIHPHRHILIFSSRPIDLSPIIECWCRVTKHHGLNALPQAQDYRQVLSRADYISKIGWELCDAGLRKEGRGGTRINYIDLVKNSSEWAEKQLKDYISASFGLRALHWSKGLKKYFNINEKTDKEAFEDGIIIQEQKPVYAISRRAFNELKDDFFGLMIGLDVSGGVIDGDIQALCSLHNFEIFDYKGNLVYTPFPDWVVTRDIRDERIEVSCQCKKDLGLLEVQKCP